MRFFCQFDFSILDNFDAHKKRCLKGMLKSDDDKSVDCAVKHLVNVGLVKWEWFDAPDAMFSSCWVVVPA